AEHRLNQLRRNQTCAYEHRYHHHIGVRIDHAALRTVLADGGEICRHQILARYGGVAADLRRVLRSHRVYHLLPRRGAVAAEKTVAAVGRLLRESERIGIHLPLEHDPKKQITDWRSETIAL